MIEGGQLEMRYLETRSWMGLLYIRNKLDGLIQSTDSAWFLCDPEYHRQAAEGSA